MGQFSVTIYGATGSVLSDNQHLPQNQVTVLRYRPSAAIRGDRSRCVAASPKRPLVTVQICERSSLHILNESAPGFLDRQLPACAVCELRNELDVPIVVAEGVVDPVE